MANTTDIVFWVSLAVLFALAVRGFYRSRHIGQLLVSVAILAACGAVYALNFEGSSHLQSKGEQSSTPAMIVLYVCMLVGMTCQYLYTYFLKAERERKFDVGLFIAPMFTSPLVFAPLWSAFQDTGMTLTSLKYGVFVVAFENGFFWKEFFDNRRQRHP